MIDPKTSPPSARRGSAAIPKQAVLITSAYFLAGFSLIGALAVFGWIDRTAIKYLVLAHCVVTGVVGGISHGIFTMKAGDRKGKSDESKPHS